jgi:hypothetical protein
MLISNFRLAHQIKLVNEITVYIKKTGFWHAFSGLKNYLICVRTYQKGRWFDMMEIE